MIIFLKKILKYIEFNLIFPLLLTIIFIVFASICTSGIPLILKKIIDQLSLSNSNIDVLNLLIIYSIALLLEKFFNEMQFLSYPKWENGVLQNAYTNIFESLFNVVPNYFKNRLHGTITSQIYQAIAGLDSVMFDIIFKTLPLLINFMLIMATIIWALNLTTALIVGLGAIFYATVMYFLNAKLVDSQINLRNANTEAQGITTDLIYSWKDIKLTNSHDYIKNTLNNNVKKILNASKTFYFKRGIYGFIQSSIVCLVIILANYYEIIRYINKETTIGDVVLINNYLFLIMRPLESFSLILRGLSKSYSDFMAIDEILNFDNEKTKNTDCSLEINSIHLSNIKVNNLIDNISLDIRKGDKIAIIGQSGSGKSTLLNIISGFRTDYLGKIFINNDVNQVIEPSVLRNHIAYCHADARLINDSLFNNICLGKKTDIQSHINVTSLQEKIINLENNFDSMISENSVLLSAGEIQRVKMARTVALNKSFEFYDESSSALDDLLTEKILKKLLMRKDKAIVFITHNTKFLNFFEKTYCLTNGNLSILHVENQDV